MATITPMRQATPIPIDQYAPMQTAKMLTPEEAAEFEAGGGKYVNPLDPDEGRWINVRLASSHVDAFRYDAPRKMLYVRFQPDAKTGHMAQGHYLNVPLEAYIELKEAVSFGSAIWHQFRNRYTWVRDNYSLKPKK